MGWKGHSQSVSCQYGWASSAHSALSQRSLATSACFLLTHDTTKLLGQQPCEGKSSLAFGSIQPPADLICWPLEQWRYAAWMPACLQDALALA